MERPGHHGDTVWRSSKRLHSTSAGRTIRALPLAFSWRSPVRCKRGSPSRFRR